MPVTLVHINFDLLEDQDVITKCLAQTPGAFEQLMNRYLKVVYNVVYHFVQNVELAEDLTQETFLRVYRNLHQYNPQKSFKPWLLTIATNVCKTALKKQSHQPLLLSQEALDRNILENIPDPHSPNTGFTDEKTEEVLKKALEQLPDNIRQAIILRHIHDLSYEEVAETMNTKLNTVRTWLKRGRESLKTILESQGGLTS